MGTDSVHAGNGEFIPYAEEPKKKERKPSMWEVRLNKLKTFPPGWYVVGVFETSLTQAATYKTNFSKKEKFKDFKFQAGQTDKGSKLYARYSPNDNPATAETAPHHQPSKPKKKK